MSPPIPRRHESGPPIRLGWPLHGARCSAHASADKPTSLFQLNVARFYILLLKYQHHDLVPCIRHVPRHFAKRSNGRCASYVCFAPPFLTSLNNQRFALHCAVYVVLCSTFYSHIMKTQYTPPSRHIEIRAAEGGDDAKLLVGIQAQFYEKHALSQGWTWSILSTQPG